MEGYRRPPRAHLLRRRAAAVGLALAATAALWFGLARSEDEDADPASRPQAAAPSRVAGLVAGLSDEQLVDQVLLLGFDGTGGGAPFVDEVAKRQLGGVLIGPQNWPDAGSGAALVDAIRVAG